MADAADLPARADLIRRVFGRYVDAPIWVAWQQKPNPDPAKDPIKVPIDPNTGRAASVTDPKSWSAMGKAMAYAHRTGLAGIGIMTGPDPDTNPDGAPDKPFIVGVDYDNALRADGTLMPWAEAQFLEGTYAEISPSGTGVKAYAVVAGRPEGLPPDRDGTVLRLGQLEPATSNGKRAGVEVYTNRRWFAVTGVPFRGSDAHKIADMTQRIPILLRHAAPAQMVSLPEAPRDIDDTTTPQDARDAHAHALSDTDRATLAAAMLAYPDLAQAMVGADWADRSMALFTAADAAKGHKLSFGQFVHGIMASTGSAAEHVRAQPDPYRALARAWDRSPQPKPLDAVPPADPDAHIGDRPGVAKPDFQPVDLSMLDQPNPLGLPMHLPLDLYRNPPPLPKFILPQLLPATPMAFVGTGGVFKSTIWCMMAIYMVLDRPLWGQTWWEGGNALMLTKEDDRSVILNRVKDLLHRLNVTERQYQDIVARRIFIDDMTGTDIRLVEADRKGNLSRTPAVEHLIDKYAGHGVTMAAIDPMNMFGPGEVHGNDGAGMMMQVAWSLCRGWGTKDMPANVSYVHHTSTHVAREEIEDAHAGRGASAVGDNARAVWVLHRHKLVNPGRHVAPPTIPPDAIARGDVIRLHMAKNSHARRIMQPFWAWRDESGLFTFEMPMDDEAAEAAAARAPTAAEVTRQARAVSVLEDLKDWARSKPGGFTRAMFTTEARTRRMGSRADELLQSFIDEGSVTRKPGLAEIYEATAPAPANQTIYGF